MTERSDLGRARRIVVKIGSALLAAGGDDAFGRVAADVATARADGRSVVLVSSGAIALGWPDLGFTSRPADLAGLQAAAAASSF